MALAYTTRIGEVQMLQEELSSIEEIEQAFAQLTPHSLSLLIVLPEHNPAIERRLAEVEGKIIDSFPWLDVDFDVVLRCGRDIKDVVTPKGFQLLAR